MTDDTREGNSEAQRSVQRPITARIVERMRIGRQLRRWSAAELAERMTTAGIHWKRNVVADLENGFRKDITADELVALAFVFNVPVTGFLSDGPREPSEDTEDRLRRLEAAVFGAKA